MGNMHDVAHFAATLAADRIWPVAGDPSLPQTREESDGWCNAYDAFIRGTENANRYLEGDTSYTPPIDDQNDVWSAGYYAGWEWQMHHFASR